MKKLLKTRIFAAFSIMLLLASCSKDYFDINTDPNNPTVAELAQLLPTTEVGIGNALVIGNGFSEVLSVYTHQLSTREEPDKYGATGQNFYIENGWPILYQTVVTNLEKIISDGTANDNMAYVGIAKVLKAYTFSQLVDIFGDIPFSEATKLNSGITYPVFDDDASIYPQLLSLLDEAIGNLTNTDAANTVSPGSDDVIYGGDVNLWVKAANTIKLKLYTQERLVTDVKSQVTQLVNNGNLISSTDESFIIPYGPNGATDDRNPGFGEYYASQRGHYISPWFYEILKGYNTTVNTGIEDPRIPYYFYNQLGKIEDPKEGNQTEYRDSGFVSIYFGSVGPNRDRSEQNTMTVMGLYPVGGKYDDGSAESVSSSSGTGAAPYRLITYADRLYLEAELIHVGLISGDERATLESAMEESFNLVDFVSDIAKGSQTVPELAGSDAATNYIDEVLAEYDAGNADKKFQIIMTEKWISSFGSSVDQYTDYRRTNYPILFDPTNNSMAPGGMVQPPIDGDPSGNPGAQPAVRVQTSRDYPLSLPWPTSELETNRNAPAQKENLAAYKIFWIP